MTPWTRFWLAACCVAVSVTALYAFQREFRVYTSLEGYDTDTVFAWQAFAGVRFSLTQHMGLSFEYRYFESDSPRWRADFAFGTDTSFMRFGKIHTQAISVAFDWTF